METMNILRGAPLCMSFSKWNVGGKGHTKRHRGVTLLLELPDSTPCRGAHPRGRHMTSSKKSCVEPSQLMLDNEVVPFGVQASWYTSKALVCPKVTVETKNS